MPVIQLPLVKGSKTDLTEADWVDSLPVNMLAVPKPVLNASGYMRSWAGLDKLEDVNGLGRGGMFNVVTKSVFRINGDKLQETDSLGVTTTRADVPNVGHVPMAISNNTTSFAANGTLYYWDGSTRTELTNWAEGEKFTTTPDPIYSLKFDGVDSRVEIPPFIMEAGQLTRISFVLHLTDATTKQVLFSSSSVVDWSMYVESGEIKYHRSGDPAESGGTVVIGRNEVIVTIDQTLATSMALIGAHSTDGVIFSDFLTGTLTSIDLRRSDLTDTRFYAGTIQQDSVPNTTLFNDTLSVEGDTDGETFNASWELFPEQPEPELSPPTDFDLTNIIDVTRNRGRYVFIQEGKGTFGVTDIQNEQKIDFIAPFYSAETNPDLCLAIDTWRDFVAVFSRFSVEFFRLTGQAELIYTQEPSLTVQAGTVGTGAVCRFMDNFAVVGGPEGEPVSVFLVAQGSYKELATRRIQKLIRSYSLAELEGVYIEAVKYDSHDMIIIHLPNETLVYDGNASDAQNSRWTILESGKGTYRGIYHIHDDNAGKWTVADKEQSVTANLDWSIGSHFGESIEYRLDTPMIQARNRRLFDFEIDTVSGRTNEVERLAISTTINGISYVSEEWINFNKPSDFTSRVLLRRVGYCENNIGWRLRWVTKNATSVSDCRVRIQ